MKIITSDDMVKDVIRKFKVQYGGRMDEPFMWYNTKPSEVLKQLESLENPTPEQINKIMGNSTWTTIMCDDCGDWVDTAVEIGDETYCRKCYGNFDVQEPKPVYVVDDTHNGDTTLRTQIMSHLAHIEAHVASIKELMEML